MSNLLVVLITTSCLQLRMCWSVWLEPESPVLLRHRREGDIIIGGIFPLHLGQVSADRFQQKYTSCTRFDLMAYDVLQVMMFVLESTNRDPLILPNITLGSEIYDSCLAIPQCIESTFLFLSGKQLCVPGYTCATTSVTAAMIAEYLSGNSDAIARLLGLYRFPQVSYGSKELYLSDRHHFPSFLRTAPSNMEAIGGMVSLLHYFNWTMVGLLVPYQYSGQESILVLKEKLITAGICIALFEHIPVNLAQYPYLAMRIKSVSPKVIITCRGPVTYLIAFMAQFNIIGITWIGLDSWPQSTLFTFRKIYHDVLEGALWFSMEVNIIPGFKDFFYNIHPSKDPNNVFIRIFWETIYQCTWKIQNYSKNIERIPCTGMENTYHHSIKQMLFDDGQSEVEYATYNAACAVIQALHELQACRPGDGPFINGSCAQFPHFHPWQLFYYLFHVHFKTAVGENIFFNEDGYLPANYYIVNFQKKNGTVQFEIIGKYKPKDPSNRSLTIIDKAITWNGGHNQAPRAVCSESCLPGFRKITQRDKPVCCYDCMLCAAGEISNYSDATDCLVCPSEDWPNERKDKCIPKSTVFLSYIDHLGAVLAVAAVTCSLLPAVILTVFVKFSDSPLVRANNRNISYLLLVSLLLCFLCSLLFIGHPSAVTCRLHQVVFGITFVFSVSCVLAKTFIVVVAFNVTKPNSHLRSLVKPQIPYFIVFLCTLVQVIICINWIIFASPFPEKNFKSQPELIIIECNEGSTVAFWCMLGYIGLLAGTCFIVAFLSRNLPDSFNEAKFITFSMIVFVSVWLAFIPAYLSTKGKYMVAVEVFAIIASSLGLVICIFFPKCYIILMRPDINTREYINKKGMKSDGRI